VYEWGKVETKIKLSYAYDKIREWNLDKWRIDILIVSHENIKKGKKSEKEQSYLGNLSGS
jgi:hypothetical protein